MGVHLFGRALDWDGLEAIVPTGMSLIEDAAGALGARFKGRACGSLGIMGCLSFHPRKTVTTGEGGAVTTDNGDLADAVRRGRHHGIEPRGPFEILQASTNYRLSDLACAIGIPQMRRLDTLLAARARIAHGYSERLAALSDRVLCPSASAGDEHGWQAYVVQLDRRDVVMAALRAEEIECQIGTYALHRLGAYSDQGPFPAADRVFERALALPLHSQLTGSDLDRVSEVLARALDA
jgi:dTDP-4-amino-4,6-dideoxygalactose transaminase